MCGQSRQKKGTPACSHCPSSLLDLRLPPQSLDCPRVDLPPFKRLCPRHSRLRHPEVSRGRFLHSDTFVLLSPLSLARPPSQPTTQCLSPRLAARLSLPFPSVAFCPFKYQSLARDRGGAPLPTQPSPQPTGCRLWPPLLPTPPDLPHIPPSNNLPTLGLAPSPPPPPPHFLFPWPSSPWKSGFLSLRMASSPPLPSPLSSSPFSLPPPVSTPSPAHSPSPSPAAPLSLSHLFVSAENRLLGTVPTLQCLW